MQYIKILFIDSTFKNYIVYNVKKINSEQFEHEGLQGCNIFEVRTVVTLFTILFLGSNPANAWIILGSQ